MVRRWPRIVSKPRTSGWTICCIRATIPRKPAATGAWPGGFGRADAASSSEEWSAAVRAFEFGGVKASGLGREGGAHSLDFYTESRIVHVPLADTHVPRFGA